MEQKLNSFYDAGALNTYGLDVGYFITPHLHASARYYNQPRDREAVERAGVRGRLAYDISQGLTTGINISYDEAFDTKVSTDLKVRFGGAATIAQSKKVQKLPAIRFLFLMPFDREIRTHDFPVL